MIFRIRVSVPFRLFIAFVVALFVFGALCIFVIAQVHVTFALRGRSSTDQFLTNAPEGVTIRILSTFAVSTALIGRPSLYLIFKFLIERAEQVTAS